MECNDGPLAARGRCAFLLVFVLAAAAGCSHLGLGAGASIREHREAADLAIEARDWETAYRHLRALRVEHPGRPETAEVFPLAGAVYRRLYFSLRYTEPDSPWLTSEPDFLFAWLETFYGEEGFPQEQTEAVLAGMPYSFAERFLAWAAGRPATARWEIRVVEDNGIVESVSAEALAQAP